MLIYPSHKPLLCSYFLVYLPFARITPFFDYNWQRPRYYSPATSSSERANLKDQEEQPEEEKQPSKLELLLAQSKFSCGEKKDGYYADTSVGCQVFHYCVQGAKHSWMCPERKLIFLTLLYKQCMTRQKGRRQLRSHSSSLQMKVRKLFIRVTNVSNVGRHWVGKSFKDYLVKQTNKRPVVWTSCSCPVNSWVITSVFSVVCSLLSFLYIIQLHAVSILLS